jgi:hypothetical protein
VRDETPPDRPPPDASGGADATAAAVDVADELDRLARESAARQRELLAIAAQLPAAVSRRSLLRQMVRDLGRAPDKPEVARRVVVKALRTPGDLYRRASGR